MTADIELWVVVCVVRRTGKSVRRRDGDEKGLEMKERRREGDEGNGMVEGHWPAQLGGTTNGTFGCATPIPASCPGVGAL